MRLVEWLTFFFDLSVKVKKILFLSYIPHTREGPWILWDTAFFPSINTEWLTLNKKNINFFFLIVVDFVIYWNETAMGLHVFPIPIPPATSLC